MPEHAISMTMKVKGSRLATLTEVLEMQAVVGQELAGSVFTLHQEGEDDLFQVMAPKVESELAALMARLFIRLGTYRHVSGELFFNGEPTYSVEVRRLQEHPQLVRPMLENIETGQAVGFVIPQTA